MKLLCFNKFLEVSIGLQSEWSLLQRISNLKFCLVVLPYPQRVMLNMLHMRGLISPAGAAQRIIQRLRDRLDKLQASKKSTWVQLELAVTICKQHQKKRQSRSVSMNWQIACNASIPWVLELPASHQGIAKRTARYIPWDWALACRRHCFNAWPQMDMEQRTSLLMDWFFWGGKISWGPISPSKCDHMLSIFLKCVSTYPKFPIEFLYDEIIVFSGKSDSKEMLIHHVFSTENYGLWYFALPLCQLRILRGTGLRFESKWREGKICLKLWFTRQEKRKPCRSLVMLHLVLWVAICGIFMYICSC